MHISRGWLVGLWKDISGMKNWQEVNLTFLQIYISKETESICNFKFFKGKPGQKEGGDGGGGGTNSSPKVTDKFCLFVLNSIINSGNNR